MKSLFSALFLSVIICCTCNIIHCSAFEEVFQSCKGMHYIDAFKIMYPELLKKYKPEVYEKPALFCDKDNTCRYIIGMGKNHACIMFYNEITGSVTSTICE